MFIDSLVFKLSFLVWGCFFSGLSDNFTESFQILLVDKTGAEVLGGAAKFFLAMMADDDDAGSRKSFPELTCGGEAVHVGHFNVHQDPIRQFSRVGRQHGGAVAAFGYRARGQKSADHLPESGVIVHDKKFLLALVHAQRLAKVPRGVNGGVYLKG